MAKLFIVDSNFFIQAHRATYPLDVAISFWDKVKKLACQERIVSLDKVRKELFDRNDDLENWCRTNLPENFFRNSSEAINEYIKVSHWAISKSNHYLPKAINEFLDSEEADAFLIAYAMADLPNRIIVTQEISQPERRNKIKIPEPCDYFKIRYVNTIEMFRLLGETF